MVNEGVFPLDPTTDVGKVRLGAHDTFASPLTPPRDGFGDYVMFSDMEVAQAVALASGSIPRAIGLLIKGLAVQAALGARSIRTDDLGYDNQKRGATLMQIAQSWLAQADAGDAADNPLAVVPVNLSMMRGLLP